LAILQLRFNATKRPVLPPARQPGPLKTRTSGVQRSRCAMKPACSDANGRRDEALGRGAGREFANSSR